MPPKLGESFLFAVLASVMLAVAWKTEGGTTLPGWFRYALAVLGACCAAWAFLTTINWVLWMIGVRMRDISGARVHGAVMLANSIKSLTTYQTEVVASHDRMAISLLVDEDGPLFFVRCLGMEVPYPFVEDFLIRSQETEPYLFPVRDSGNEAFARAITDLIKSKGWAESASGPFSAKLTKPLVWVSSKFGVVEEEEE